MISIVRSEVDEAKKGEADFRSCQVLMNLITARGQGVRMGRCFLVANASMLQSVEAVIVNSALEQAVRWSFPLHS